MPLRKLLSNSTRSRKPPCCVQNPWPPWPNYPPLRWYACIIGQHLAISISSACVRYQSSTEISPGPMSFVWGREGLGSLYLFSAPLAAGRQHKLTIQQNILQEHNIIFSVIGQVCSAVSLTYAPVLSELGICLFFCDSILSNFNYRFFIPNSFFQI